MKQGNNYIEGFGDIVADNKGEVILKTRNN